MLYYIKRLAITIVEATVKVHMTIPDELREKRAHGMRFWGEGKRSDDKAHPL